MPLTDRSIGVQDEGVDVGRARSVNFAGAGVTAVVTGGVATVTVPGGGGGGGITTFQAEVSLGSSPVRSGRFTISDASIIAGQRVFVFQSGAALTGKGTLGDENQMDSICVAPVVTGDGSMTVYWTSRTFVKGNFKFNWFTA